MTWIRENCPNVKLLFSWADGLRGKPGYVYQASSWLYGGFIKTELYVDEHGGPVHPRLFVPSHPPNRLSPLMRTFATLPETFA